METLILILIALLAYTFFSGIEYTYIQLYRFHFFYEEEKNKNLLSQILNIFEKNLSQFIYTLLTGCLLSLFLYGVLSAQFWYTIISTFTNNIILIFLLQIVISFLVLFLLSEVFFKILFKLNGRLFIHLSAIPMAIFYFICYPLVWLFSKISELFFTSSGLNIKKEFKKDNIKKGYLDYFLQRSLENLQQYPEVKSEVKLFQNALDFSNVKIKNCIVPRTEIVAVDQETPKEELKQLFIKTGLSKIIVYKEDLDNIIGYIHSSEMFKKEKKWQNSIKNIPVVPEAMIAIKLMNMLMQEKKSIAAVIDEFGGTSGIVTLEDLVEEIFGDIEDEHDSQHFLAKKLDENTYILSGRNEVDKINEQFSLNLPESEEYITIAGLILNYYQKFPKQNEKIELPPFTFEIIRQTPTKIELVKLKVKQTDMFTE
ncbi:MAG: hemolysin family protein [Candidatus Azobacteroides sp.]|nr:hemolysin family protein [Candidatus Azobacteroides sp.]